MPKWPAFISLPYHSTLPDVLLWHPKSCFWTKTRL